jgi:hypothetical protein
MSLTTKKGFRALNGMMKTASDRKPIAPAPRVTLWVPALVAGAVSVLWLGLWAMT